MQKPRKPMPHETLPPMPKHLLQETARAEVVLNHNSPKRIITGFFSG